MHFVVRKSSILIQFSLKFVPRGPMDNKSIVLTVMAWRRTGDKSLGSTWTNCQYNISQICLIELCTRHYNDVIMGAMASQITSLTSVCSTVYLGADQRKHQSSASLAFVRGIHRWPVNSPHKWPVTRKMFSFNDVIMVLSCFVFLLWFYFSYLWSHVMYSPILCGVAYWQWGNRMIAPMPLTLWGRETHIYASVDTTIIASDMACRLFSANSLSEPMLTNCQFEPC